MKGNKVFTYINNHKKEVIILIGTMTAGIILCAVTRKRLLSVENYLKTELPKKALPELAVGTVEDFDEYKDAFELMVNDIPLGRLGEFGKELCEKIDGVDENTKIWGLIDLYKKEVKEV